MKRLLLFALLLCTFGCSGFSTPPAQKLSTGGSTGGQNPPAPNPSPTPNPPPSPTPNPTPNPTSYSGTVQITLPTANLFLSGVRYVATATTTCPKGISSIGILSGPNNVMYSVKGAQLDTVLNLAPGDYQTVVQEWDNCNGTATAKVAVSIQQPTTTLSAQTSNNTSAADSFHSLSDGDEGATNVSKANLRTLLYPGSTTEIYGELQPWFGDKRHMNVGYASWNPTQVERQIEDMQSRGITGIVFDWYGPADDTEATMQAWLATLPNHPGFKLIVMIDKGAIQLSPCSGCNPQQTLIYLTNYVLQHYATSPSYATLNGNPIITQFDIDLHYSINWNTVQQQTSPNIAWIFENNSGFTHPITAGSWSWVNISANYGFDYLDQFYTTANHYPKEMAWGATYKGFNDTLASWGKDRIIGQQCGETWLQTFNILNSYYNSGNQLPILQLVTWNDYEEGTEIESGIDNCLTVNPSINGSQLQWSVNGNEQTVSQYVVYISTDGQNLLALDTLPVGSRQVNLAPYSLATGTYLVYVQAIGQPTIKNQMSGPVQFVIP